MEGHDGSTAGLQGNHAQDPLTALLMAGAAVNGEEELTRDIDVESALKLLDELNWNDGQAHQAFSFTTDDGSEEDIDSTISDTERCTTVFTMMNSNEDTAGCSQQSEEKRVNRSSADAITDDEHGESAENDPLDPGHCEAVTSMQISADMFAKWSQEIETTFSEDPTLNTEPDR
jgi:hypothetical protein